VEKLEELEERATLRKQNKKKLARDVGLGAENGLHMDKSDQ